MKIYINKNLNIYYFYIIFQMKSYMIYIYFLKQIINLIIFCRFLASDQLSDNNSNSYFSDNAVNSFFILSYRVYLSLSHALLNAIFSAISLYYISIFNKIIHKFSLHFYKYFIVFITLLLVFLLSLSHFCKCFYHIFVI